MYFITVPDANDAITDVSVESERFRLRTTWNVDGGFWSFGFADDNDNMIFGGVRVFPFIEITRYAHRQYLPQGGLYVISRVPVIGRKSFANGDCKLVYYTPRELEEIYAKLEAKL